jgi:alpha-beta hydrolase superfamily lysophospholipase
LSPTEFNLIAIDGIPLFGLSWVPKEPRAVVCLIHGLGEHIGRYDHVARHFNRSGIAVYGIDQRGHGRNPGKKGHVTCQNLWDDVEWLMKEARMQHLDLPMFLYGHSWGGNIVINFLLRRSSGEIKGAVLSSPWLQLSFEPTRWHLLLGRWMSRIYPGFIQANELSPEHLSRDASVGEAYLSDPLVHDKISAGVFMEAVSNGIYALDHAEKLSIPVLIMHGTDDRITSVEASKAFSISTAKYSTLKLWPQMRHETHNELGKEEVLDYVSQWLISKSN